MGRTKLWVYPGQAYLRQIIVPGSGQTFLFQISISWPSSFKKKYGPNMAGLAHQKLFPDRAGLSKNITKPDWSVNYQPIQTSGSLVSTYLR